MMSKTLGDSCVELEIVLEIFEEHIRKFCKSYFISRNLPKDTMYTDDDLYIKWENGKCRINTYTGFPVMKANPIRVKTIDVLKKVVTELRSKLDEERSNYPPDSQTRALDLIKRADDLLIKWEERKYFVLSFWEHTKLEEES